MGGFSVKSLFCLYAHKPIQISPEKKTAYRALKISVDFGISLPLNTSFFNKVAKRNLPNINGGKQMVSGQIKERVKPEKLQSRSIEQMCAYIFIIFQYQFIYLREWVGYEEHGGQARPDSPLLAFSSTPRPNQLNFYLINDEIIVIFYIRCVIFQITGCFFLFFYFNRAVKGKLVRLINDLLYVQVVFLTISMLLFEFNIYWEEIAIYFV